MSLSRRELFLTPALLGAQPAGNKTPLDRYFLEILEGFLRNARRTSSSYAVCDFADGTVLPGAVGRSGKTYDSVTRMMPAMAAWVAGNREGQTPELLDALVQMFRNAFNPAHPDYWLPSPGTKQQQRQVEASIVAWSLWLLRDKLLPKLTSAERTNIQNWLASCTLVPARKNNWAWFTAVNHAVRLSLGERWKEFSGDAAFMIADLQVLDRMAVAGSDGWYSDSLTGPIYDYYNFWVFASHFLYWNKVIGARYPEWSEKFGARLRAFLQRTPHFFGANGSHVLFGRSLIYRFGVLTPLALAYEQKLWPHSPGLLRAIVRRNLEFHWSIGGFDRERGKLRETYSAVGNRDICDSYIDNGHPYWGMQAFAFFLIPAHDSFWTAKEEPLPVERGDFDLRFEAEKMRLIGTRESGQVRWVQSVTHHGGADYRDKYTKLSYSTHFPFDILPEKDRAVWDGTLILRDPKSGVCAARLGVTGGRLTDKGVETNWWTTLNGARIEVTTQVEYAGGTETRRHTIVLPPGVAAEAVEGSYALGLAEGERAERGVKGNRLWLGPARSGLAVVSWHDRGWERSEVAEVEKRNVVYAHSAVNTFRATLHEGRNELVSRHWSGRKLPG
jgi:hypothetical protein